MKIVFAPEAVDDLAAAIEYLRERDPQAAVATADSVFRAIDRLADRAFEGPELELRRAGRKGPELASPAVPDPLPPRG